MEGSCRCDQELVLLVGLLFLAVGLAATLGIAGTIIGWTAGRSSRGSARQPSRHSPPRA